MLTHIHIRNVTIADEVEVEFGPGMTALTGETGAGKSLLVDALGLVLGDRADSGIVRHGCDRAEISVDFDITACAAAADWLRAHELDADGECQLRRIINREGRSRGYVNNRPVPAQSLRELGECLVDIHGQHEHQSLLDPAVQRRLLDDHAGHHELMAAVAARHAGWDATRRALAGAMRAGAEDEARVELLRYQLHELDALGLDAAGIAELGRDHDRLANAGQLLSACRKGMECLDAETGASARQLVNAALAEIEPLSDLDAQLAPLATLLGEIRVLLEECSGDLRRYADTLEIDPDLLRELGERLGMVQDLARKHRCRPEELPRTHGELRAELERIETADRDLGRLQAQLERQADEYSEAAQRLSASRGRAARRLAKQVSADMQQLGMPGGVFEVDVRRDPDRAFAAHGLDRVGFRVSANPGQPAGPLNRVASGGELSRISLAIQVICLRSEHVPTLIFDEVDTGIGGAVAEIVGQKLRALGEDRQVVCVTHLPQVAALASHQLQVSKLTGEDTTRTHVRLLGEDERVDEIARMLGGLEITGQSRKHAREFLARGNTKSAGRRTAPRSKRRSG